jgi:hypothetical protein
MCNLVTEQAEAVMGSGKNWEGEWGLRSYDRDGVFPYKAY